MRRMPLAIVRTITGSITSQGKHALTSILSLPERKKSDPRWPKLLLRRPRSGLYFAVPNLIVETDGTAG
jgi:hypothetical protein